MPSSLKMKKGLFICLFILFAAIFVFLQSNFLLSQSFVSKDSILNFLSHEKEEYKLNAIIGGVWKNDNEIVATGIGESMTGVPAARDMYVRIGGISEIFFGALVMILADQNKINLDDKISAWVPELLGADKVTVRMLINNTAGYKDYVQNKTFLEVISKNPFRQFSRDEIIGYSVSGGELNFPPGTEQKYSHTEFTILGKVLELATGKSMSLLYQENIFDPLRLAHTGYSFTADIPFPVLHSFSKGSGDYEDATFWNPSWTGDSGPLYSTISDIMQLSQILGYGKLLSQKSLMELTAKPKAAKNPELYYATGFVVSNGWYVQNPSFNGFSGAFGYEPEKNLTVVIFTTETEETNNAFTAFEIFKKLVSKLTPERQINF